jgi:hypothetical protein
MLSSTNACLIVARIPVTLFFQDLYKFAPLLDPSRNHVRPDTQYTISTPTQLSEMVYTDSQDSLVLSSTILLHYYDCCTDGSTSSRNSGYPTVLLGTKYCRNKKDKFSLMAATQAALGPGVYSACNRNKH